MSSEELPELFAEALSRDEAGREALLAEVATRDPALAAELNRLITGAATPSALLDCAPWPVAAGVFEPADDPGMPERIGPYRILRELGRGGMGRVYLAEEETADYTRTIALKVIDHPAPEALRRFRDEVRILSSLDHPGIARFIHGGRAPDGTWFLALEPIEGEDLLTYVRRLALPVEKRIELFIAVLAAVEFAHRRGVVHRDLKPRHLLVGADGRPRLLDFGISKLLDPETRESLAVTRTEARALTPAYASPEQIRGAPVTPASDIFSLGVVLYELLSGHRPFAADGDSRVALERAVLETDPLPPSLAARRSVGERLSSPGGALGRDLDAVCLKALRKEPADRYASAAELAADLQRCLERRPVLARRGGWRYSALRFAGRQRGRLITAAALALALAAVVFAWRVNGGADRARPAAPGVAAPAAPARAAGDGSESIDELERRFAAAPASLQAGAALATALLREERFKEAAVVVSRARQLPGAAEDALLDKIEAMIANSFDESQRALALYRRALGNAAKQGHADLVPSLRAGVARCLADLGQTAEGHATLLEARREAEQLGDRSTLALVLNDLAVGELMQGNLAGGEELLVQALVPARELANSARLGFVLDNLSGIAIERGRPDLAEARYREAIDVWQKLGRTQRAAIASGNRALALADLGRGAEAAAVRESAIAALRSLDDRSSVAVILAARAHAAIDAGDLAAAERDAEEIDAVALANGNRENLAHSEELRGRIAWLRGDLAAARRNLAQAESFHVADGDLDLAGEVALRRAGEEFREGAYRTAENLLAEALDRLDGADGTTTALLAGALRVRIAAMEGRPTEAQQLFARLDEATAISPSLARRLAYLAARGTLSAGLGKLAAARDDFRSAAALAESAGLAVTALELRLDLAVLEQRAGLPSDGTLALGLANAAEALGLRQLAERARRIRSGAVPVQ